MTSPQEPEGFEVMSTYTLWVPKEMLPRPLMTPGMMRAFIRREQEGEQQRIARGFAGEVIAKALPDA
ncbi:MAG: hypothetical protein ACE37J_13915 [Pikeienuella sp.]|uniref:hypothetical protein n=1 Tax=Pikeienuella sp. TaxID=2831957 RepID=UPI00391DB3A4